MARLMPTARFLGTVKFLDNSGPESGSQDRTWGYTKQENVGVNILDTFGVVIEATTIV